MGVPLGITHTLLIQLVPSGQQNTHTHTHTHTQMDACMHSNTHKATRHLALSVSVVSCWSTQVCGVPARRQWWMLIWWLMWQQPGQPVKVEAVRVWSLQAEHSGRELNLGVTTEATDNGISHPPRAKCCQDTFTKPPLTLHTGVKTPGHRQRQTKHTHNTLNTPEELS